MYVIIKYTLQIDINLIITIKTYKLWESQLTI